MVIKHLRSSWDDPSKLNQLTPSKGSIIPVEPSMFPRNFPRNFDGNFWWVENTWRWRLVPEAVMRKNGLEAVKPNGLCDKDYTRMSREVSKWLVNGL